MKIVVHIGYYKTGTTSLQEHFDSRRVEHTEQGLLYPAAPRPPLPGGEGHHANHSTLPFALLEQEGRDIPPWFRRSRRSDPEATDFAPVMSALQAEIADSDATTVLISSEEFIRFGEDESTIPLVTRVCEQLGDHEIEAIVYLRRPDRYLDSWYNQLVKMGLPRPRLSDDMDAYLHTVHVDFARALQPWVDVLGKEKVSVRNYDELGDRSVVEDLLGVLGRVDLAEPAGTERSNQRVPNLFVESKRVWNHLAKPKQRPVFDRQSRRIAPLIEFTGKVTTLDERARKILHGAFLPVNEALGEMLELPDGFFTDLDDMLALPDDTITDLEAHRMVSPYLALAFASR